MMARVVALLAVLLGSAAGVHAQARVTIEERSLTTYPFSDPDPVPILASDPRLYPYHRFGGYTNEARPESWTVVHLENEWIELWVLPEVGGKVWGARVKESGHEFIYRNEVMKFRNIALRGPWTSGGIEFNFGVIGHTPATATPVDWKTTDNADGSVSVHVGTMDLPSQTTWRVEIRLPADRAYFETHALWHNPTVLEQPYYNWMTGAAFAQDDLVLTVPGTAYLEHPGGERSWPLDDAGRNLPEYAENRFGGNKSYHVVGAYEDFFGGYYRDDDYGFGHWSPYEEMPGQKIWLWALSRQGGIWEDLLTDTDGQYVEFQAGRLLVQYSPSGEVNPISEVGFEPGALDRWTETWFPVEGLGGLSDASKEGAMFVEVDPSEVVVHAHAFGDVAGTVVVRLNGEIIDEEAVSFAPLEPVTVRASLPSRASTDVIEVEVPEIGLEWSSDPEAGALGRRFDTESDAWPSIPEARRDLEAAAELVEGRRFIEAARLYSSVLDEEPWNREALLGLADLDFRRGLFEDGLVHAERVLRLDAYDAEANFAAGRLYRALGRELDAREAFGWAARSMSFRSVANLQLAELALRAGEAHLAARHAERALDYDRHSLGAHEMRAVVARSMEDEGAWADALAAIREIDPLSHFVRFEEYLAGGSAEALIAGFRSEFPAQEVLELGIRYHQRGRDADAERAFDVAAAAWGDPIARAWKAYLTDSRLDEDEPFDVAYVAPFRTETIRVLEYAVEQAEGWEWRYLLALNLWGRDRADEAAELFVGLGNEPDQSAAYAARAAFATSAGDRWARDVYEDLWPEGDFRAALAMAPGDRMLVLALVEHLLATRRWSDAAAEARDGRSAFPGDFDLGLLYATALNALGRFEEASIVLDEVDVLPSEHSSASHRLFAHAHVALGLDALEEGRPDEAVDHFATARSWPEHLGLGRPYEPEERLPLLLEGVARVEGGDWDEAAEAFGAVGRSTPSFRTIGVPMERLDLLGVLAAHAMGETGFLVDFAVQQHEGALARIAAAIRAAAQDEGGVAAALRDAAESSPSVFSDVEGALLLRAIRLVADRLE